MTSQQNQPREALQKELGERRMQEALDAMERAQRELGKACEALCPVLGGLNHWKRVGKLYDAVNEAWHNVNGFAERERRKPAGLRVDDHHADYVAEKAAQRATPAATSSESSHGPN